MLTPRIALRYLVTKKSHRAVNIISAISMTGVAVATAAIVVVLSVFNGFNRLSVDQLSRIDPDLKILPARGSAFAGGDSLALTVASLPGVAAATAVIEQRAMLDGAGVQMPVRFKAVGDSYKEIIPFDGNLLDGVYMTRFDSLPCLSLSVGVANATGLRPSPQVTAAIYVPRRVGRINPARPDEAFRSAAAVVSSVFAVDQADTDADMVVMPLAMARGLLDYRDGEATAVEAALEPGADAAATLRSVAAAVGDGYRVLDRADLSADTLRMIRVEKWITFMMLMFILVIASFNIISTLSLLVIEKRGDCSTLRALGLSKGGAKSIFAWQGLFITLAGGAAGMVFGVVLTLTQQWFGIIRLSGDPSTLTTDVYPVALQGGDLALVGLSLVAVGLLTSLSSRLFTSKL